LPIRRLIEKEIFDPEALQVISTAFDDALRELGLSDRGDPVVELVARRIITFAQQGERDPVKLRDLALKSLRD
jgi:hypothetical protein